MEDRCNKCQRFLRKKIIARPIHDTKWPSGKTSGRGKVKYETILYCPHCDSEPISGKPVFEELSLMS